MTDFKYVFWESEAPKINGTVEETDHFDARGMKRIYGRGDMFGKHSYFRMDIWQNKNNRLFMRCWSRCGEIDWRSFEITGIDVNTLTSEEDSIPQVVRDAYAEWIEEEF